MICFKKTPKASKIDQQIREDRKQQNRKVKLLLLGTGDSGKSTFTKQVKVLYKGGFTEQELNSYADVILTRTIHSLNSIVGATKTMNIKISPSVEEASEKLAALNRLTADSIPLVKLVWSDPGIQKVYARRNEFQLDSNTFYYFENMERFTLPNFEPSLSDIFQVRHKTSGIMETTFQTGGLDIILVDVGGQRSERRKWLHCFEGVTAVIYFISLEEYNMQLSEDYRVNRLQEALDLFEEITASEFFTKTHFFVFYNKVDLFRTKMKTQPMSDLFEDFVGEDTYENSLKYIQNQFESRFSGSKERYSSFVTCSLDTESIEKNI